MNYYSFHIGDYKSHTNHLSLLEDLAYRRMLDMYYLTESPLPDIQKIARHICMRDNIDDIQSVLNEFFILVEDGYIHARCEREIQAMNNKSGKAKASAQARWERQRNANASKNHANASNLDANAMRNGCEGNAPNPNTHNPTPIPEKKEKSAYEESENPAPPLETDPAYAQIDTKGPYKPFESFQMFAGWKPDPVSWDSNLKSAFHKVKPEQFTDYTLAEFVFRNSKGQEKTEQKWQLYYINAVAQGMLDKPAPNQPSGGRGYGQPADDKPKPKYDDPSHRPFKRDEPSPGLSPGKLEELKQKARDMGIAV